VANYGNFHTDPYYTSIMATTVVLPSWITVACLTCGFPLGTTGWRTRRPLKHLLIISIILRVVGKRGALRGRDDDLRHKGVVNATLMGLGLIDKPTPRDRVPPKMR